MVKQGTAGTPAAAEAPTKFIYGGLSGVELATASFDLGEGVLLRNTYAHFMSPNMMAFARPGPEGFHPAPWRGAKGGDAFDIEVEIRAPDKTSLGDVFDAKEAIWWIAALLRLASRPFVSVPVLSDQPYDAAANSAEEPTLRVSFKTVVHSFSTA